MLEQDQLSRACEKSQCVVLVKAGITDRDFLSDILLLDTILTPLEIPKMSGPLQSFLASSTQSTRGGAAPFNQGGNNIFLPDTAWVHLQVCPTHLRRGEGCWGSMGESFPG